MSPADLAPLVVLALIDGTSFGTLVIPLWLMLTPRLRPDRVLVYLGVVAAAYLLLGLVLLSGATLLLDQLTAAVDSTPGQVVRLVVGVALLVLGLTIEPWTKAGKQRRADRVARRRAERGPSRMERWRTAVSGEEAAVGALALLAITAVAVEAASMVPYLAAIGILVTADLAPLAAGGTLAAYCLVMVAPALLLLGLRVALHQRIAPALTRVEAWLSRNSRETLAWVLFLLGLYLASGAADALDLGL